MIALDGQATEEQLLAQGPSVVILDMGAVQPESVLARMQALPGRVLSGIQPESHAVLLTGQAAHLITLDQQEGGMNQGMVSTYIGVEIITRLVIPDN